MKKILVIDDDESHLKMLIAALMKSKYEATGAINGDLGVKVFSEEEFDLVITDIFMPEKEGLETITEIKELYPEAKIIAISGGSLKGKYQANEILNIAKDLGANEVLSKPINLPIMLETVKRLISS